MEANIQPISVVHLVAVEVKRFTETGGIMSGGGGGGGTE